MMSNYIKWTKHPDTGHWHKAGWLDNHFGPHNYGVKFNDDQIFDPRTTELETSETEPGTNEIVDVSRDQFKELFGHAENEIPPEEPEDEEGIPTRKAKLLMVNPTDFMFLFEKGLSFRKHTKLIEGIPEDAVLLAVAADPVRHGIMLVVQSESYEPIPINQMPPTQVVTIQTGVVDATKKKKQPRKK